MVMYITELDISQSHSRGGTFSLTTVSVAYRYRKSISIIELFVSIILIYIEFLATNIWRSLLKFNGWAMIEELSIRRRVRRFLSSWGQRVRVKHYNIDLSSWYEFWFALICIDMNVISALSTAIQQFRDGFDSKKMGQHRPHEWSPFLLKYNAREKFYHRCVCVQVKCENQM